MTTDRRGQSGGKPYFDDRFDQQPPAAGSVARVADGILWIRMPLPFALDHINLWVLEDGDGWALIDTGLGDDLTQKLWNQLFEGALAGRTVTQVVNTHFHPDHIGLASWLCDRFAVPFLATATDWSFGRMLWHEDGSDFVDALVRHHHRVGHDSERLSRIRTRGHYYRKLVAPPPLVVSRIHDTDTIAIGGRLWHVKTFGGHSYEHACLWCADAGVLIVGDQVLPHISPVVAAWPQEPEAQPLAHFLASLEQLQTLPEDTLVLPSHGEPFRMLRARCIELADHHDQRLERILGSCTEPSTVNDLIGRTFRYQLDDHQMDFATGEILAHLNHLKANGLVRRESDDDGIWRFRAA